MTIKLIFFNFWKWRKKNICPVNIFYTINPITNCFVWMNMLLMWVKLDSSLNQELCSSLIDKIDVVEKKYFTKNNQ